MTNNSYDIPFEMLKLPSKGKCYSNRMDSVPVSYLTTDDENFICSMENMDNDELCDILIERKVMDKNFLFNDICSGDRDMILIWLRKTSYGRYMKVGDTSIDLDNIDINYMDIDVDDNGCVTYISSDGTFMKYIVFSSKVERDFYNELINIKDDENIMNNIISFTKKLLRYQTVSINGITDLNYINNFINKMSFEELSKYQKYTSDNTPRVRLDVRISDCIIRDMNNIIKAGLI